MADSTSARSASSRPNLGVAVCDVSGPNLMRSECPQLNRSQNLQQRLTSWFVGMKHTPTESPANVMFETKRPCRVACSQTPWVPHRRWVPHPRDVSVLVARVGYQTLSAPPQTAHLPRRRWPERSP